MRRTIEGAKSCSGERPGVTKHLPLWSWELPRKRGRDTREAATREVRQKRLEPERIPSVSSLLFLPSDSACKMHAQRSWAFSTHLWTRGQKSGVGRNNPGVHQWMNGRTEGYAKGSIHRHWDITPPQKKEGHSDTCDNRDGPRRHGVARNKPGRKRQTPYEAPGKRSLE